MFSIFFDKKKASQLLVGMPFTNIVKKLAYFKPLTNFVNFDLLLAALFLWMMFFLAKRSNIEITLGNKSDADFLSSAARNLLMKVRVVFA
ncbi:hypothetical protein OC25_16610 [Pedobacter kyungheensis]|uniref:Uncharacterized protein n=1 Tax=Pedobacter kyungheensis TaxID=1069985 RepID=A0A0C1D6E1_9SPHI|nr:hypothetical protein OC25_16610 [Pedobacter kyungheensis]